MLIGFEPALFPTKMQFVMLQTPGAESPSPPITPFCAVLLINDERLMTVFVFGRTIAPKFLAELLQKVQSLILRFAPGEV